MKRWLIRVVAILVMVEVSYLAIINALLNLPATQTYISRLQPDRLAVRWDFAWSWLPLQFQVRGLSVNGQSWSQQFEISAPAASASISIRSLFENTIEVNDLQIADVSLHLRPRPRPDRDDAALRQFYPAIEGRDPDLPADPMPVEKPGWKIVVDGARIAGRNEVWIAALRTILAGQVATTVTIQNPRGLLSVSNGQADLSVQSFTFAGRPVSEAGSIKGKFNVAPFRPLQNRGLKILAFASLDLDIDLPVDSLGFVDPVLSTMSGMRLGGSGGLSGHLIFDKGQILTGTDFVITAGELQVDLPPYSARGRGAVALTVDPALPRTLAADVRFKTVDATRDPGDVTLFTGSDIAISVARTSRVLPGADREEVPRKVTIALPAVTVPDIAVLQHYLPDEWNVEVLGGSGSLGGRAEFSGSVIDFDLTLRSDDAEVKFAANSFATDLVVGLRLRGDASTEDARVDISGTYLSLDDSQVRSARGDTSAPWRTHLAVTTGESQLIIPKQTEPVPGVFGFWRLFETEDLKSMLATADARISAALTVSDLSWLNLLFENRFALTISEPAEIQADVTVRSGSLAEGSSVASPTRAFRLEILDYVAEGSGSFELLVEKGGAHPDLRLEAVLDDASLRLLEEKDAVVEQMNLILTATGEQASLENGAAVRTVEMSIPSAKVTDMSAYNAYLPRGSPLRILGGTADLSARLVMQENNATGYVKLKASRLSADLDGQRIFGALTLDIPIRSGSAKEKRFDISGALLSVEGVGVGAPGNWSTRIDLRKARVAWKRPMSLDVTASIQMSDARPLLAIFADSRKANKWLDRLGDLRNIRADATITVAPDEFAVPFALVTSEKIAVGAKGTIREHDREGMFYARYGRLAGILAFDSGQKRFKMINATRKFDEYVLGGELPAMRDRQPSTSTNGKKPAFSIFKKR